MSSTIHVDPAELEQPARRFEVAADGLDVLVRAVHGAAATTSGAAANGNLASVAEVYGQACGAVLDAFADESRLMGGNIRQAGVSYRTTDDNAVLVQTSDPNPPRRRGPGTVAE